MPRRERPPLRSASSLAVAAGLLAVLVLPGCAPRPVGETPRPPRTETSAPEPTSAPSATRTPEATVTFAVIGDYGSGDRHARDVAKLVSRWRPAFVITTGDDYYDEAGGTGTARYDRSTGRFYCAWLKDVSAPGSRCRSGEASVNAFFPSMGNHDYSDARPSPETYLKYFTLPGEGFSNTSGNERYYDFVHGSVHFFVLNSNPDEPHGIGRGSRQAAWLRRRLERSTSRWNIVYYHHAPYSSDSVHGSTRYMRWPFAGWGADAVLSGHAHVYERVHQDGIVYFVNGLGGARRYGFDSPPVSGSKVRYRSDWGAQKVTVTDRAVDFEFYDTDGGLIDRYRLTDR